MFDRSTEKLDAGIDFQHLGNHISVSFLAEHLRDAEILWINERWWLEQEIDIFEPVIRHEVEQWLLDRFAVASCERIDLSGDAQEMLADRYGGSFGASNGGSGRCGMVGRFHAKGIGPTPLVPHPRIGPHRDGRLPLAEAIREAVSAELVQAELPFGSVPVIAIIGAGPGDECGHPDAIIVRPNFVRPAHFERSIFFGTSGTHRSDQHCDALRTRAAVEAALNAPEAIGFPGLMAMLHRCAVQLGAAQAHRLWQGRFLSSNVAVSGALVDFGSFRSIPSWRAYFGEPEEVFGRESDYLEVAWSSLSRAFRKYAPTLPIPDEPDALAKLKCDIVDGFRGAVEATLRLDTLPLASAQRLLEAVIAYFQEQQRIRCQIGESDNWRLPWIHDLLRCPSAASLPEYRAERRLLREIEEAKREISCVSGPAGSAGLDADITRWACQRPRLYYETSSPAFARVGALIARSPRRRKEILDRYISFVLSSVSRTWNDLPPFVEISGQTCRGGSTVLYGIDHRQGSRCVLARAAGRGSRARLFGTLIGQSDKTTTNSWLRLSAGQDSHRTGLSTQVGGSPVTLPPALFRYDLQKPIQSFIGSS